MRENMRLLRNAIFSMGIREAYTASATSQCWALLGLAKLQNWFIKWFKDR